MTNSQIIFRNILLNDLRGVSGIKPKALAEVLLLRAYYGKAVEGFSGARDSIMKEEAEESVKKEAVEKLLAEETEASDRKLSVASFEQIVEAVSTQSRIKTGLIVSEDGKVADIAAEDWLTTFAANIVEY